MAIQGFESLIPEVHFHGDNHKAAVSQSEAILVLTEWDEYK
jgi:hypothetical protein